MPAGPIRHCVVPLLAALSVMVGGAVAATSASATTLTAPGDPAASFTTWSQGIADLSVSWTAEDGVDGYEVDFAAGATAPTSPSAGATDVTGSASTSTVLPVNAAGGEVAVSVWAYTGTPGNFTGLSQPASVTVDLPTVPTVTATPVSGSQGEATLSWGAPAFAGDTLVLRQGPSASPTGGTAIPISAGQTSVVVTGLPNYSPSNNNQVELYELRNGDASQWSPPSSTLAYAAPGPETLFTASESDDATHVHLNWQPANCSVVTPNQVCSDPVLVENAGTKVAVDPNDGLAETALAGFPNGVGKTITDMVPGDTYTFSLFDIATVGNVEYWSAPVPLTVVDQALPTMSLTSNPAGTATSGEAVTLSTRLTTVGTTPTGTVTFQTMHRVLCTVGVSTAHTAVCHTTAAAIGKEPSAGPGSGITIYANYNGDGSDFANTATTTLNVKKISPTVTTKVAGQRTKKATVAITISGAAGAASGGVTMSVGSHTLCRTTLKSGKTTCAASEKVLGKGTHTVAIHYGGDTSYLAHTTKVTVKLGS